MTQCMIAINLGPGNMFNYSQEEHEEERKSAGVCVSVRQRVRVNERPGEREHKDGRGPFKY